MQLVNSSAQKRETKKQTYKKITREDLARKCSIGSKVRIFNGGLGTVIGYTIGPLETGGKNPGFIIMTDTGLTIKRLLHEVGVL